MLLALLAPIGFAGLLLLGSKDVGPGRRSRRTLIIEAALAAMTGVGAASLKLMRPILPYVLVPVTVSAHLGSGWIARRQWLPLGFYLVGAAGFWLSWEAWLAWNDLTDQAVSRPGWSPVPLAVALAVALVGAGVLGASLWTPQPAAGARKS